MPKADPSAPVMMVYLGRLFTPPVPFAWPSQSCLLSTNAPLAKPSPPVVSRPKSRATPGKTVNFTCKSHGFSPRNITLKWFKDEKELSRKTTTTVTPEGESVSYNVSSTAEVELTAEDVRSQVICEVFHDTLQGAFLRGTANLSDTIRGRCP